MKSHRNLLMQSQKSQSGFNIKISNNFGNNNLFGYYGIKLNLILYGFFIDFGYNAAISLKEINVIPIQFGYMYRFND